MVTREAWKTLKVTSSGNGVVVCTFNRPKRLNAFDVSMVRRSSVGNLKTLLFQYTEFKNLLITAGKDESVKVIVVTGEGDYFSSGNDLSNFSLISPKSTCQLIQSSSVSEFSCQGMKSRLSRIIRPCF